MRQVPQEMAARIESGAATLCHVWLLTRTDGERLGFTDHDRDLTIDSVACRAATGWSPGAGESATGSVAGSRSLSGVLDAETITSEDIDAGRYDRAEIELWRVDWVRPDLKVRLFRGWIAGLTRQGERFTADVEGPLAALERVIGRTYARTCDATLGDARCGVTLEGAPQAVCDRRWETCVGVFGNGINFRGFPDIPGDDWLTAQPRGGDANDGGSRR